MWSELNPNHKHDPFANMGWGNHQVSMVIAQVVMEGDEENRRVMELSEQEMYFREVDMEELEIEEVEFNARYSDSSDDSIVPGQDGRTVQSNGVTFDMCLTSLHTYLGEVDDTQHRVAFLEGGAILTLPMFYLEGVVLFPEATLPLRVIHPSCKAAIDKALDQLVAPYTIGVLRVHRHPDDGSLCFASIGTTAEIRQYKRLDDGSVNIVTRGQQRFHLRRSWIDVDGAPCAEVQIVEEDIPLRTPRDAFGQLASVSNSWRRNLSNSLPSKGSPTRRHLYKDEESDSESVSEKSFSSARSSPESRFDDLSTDSGNEHDSIFDQLANSEEEIVCEPEGSSQPKICKKDTDNIGSLVTEKEPIKCEESCKGERRLGWVASASGHRAPNTFWPNWVFRMFDSYCLAQRAADMWKKTVGAPSMDDLVNKPDLLSFYIASKIPVSESTRQELLEINGISYRLRREIELLESVDRIRCKTCETIIAKRSDMLVMSTDGPLGAYVNPHGYVHEIMTLYKVNGIALIGHPDKAYSWFPGYAWTIAVCATCEIQLGWLFTAANKKLKPRSFWGIRSSQVADVL